MQENKLMDRNQWNILLAFAAVYIIWGSTYLALMIGIQSLPPFLLSSLRFLLAGILMSGWCFLIKKEQRPSAKSTGINSIAGILTLFGGSASVAWAEQYISTSLAAIIVTAVPFWFVLLDKKQWSFYFSNKTIIAGLILGFAGVVVLVGLDKTNTTHSSTSNQLAGALAVVAGGIAWTAGSLYSKYKPTGTILLVNVAIQLLAAGVFSLLTSFIAGEWNTFSFTAVSLSSWLALLYLVLIGSIVAFSCYLFLLKVRPPALASTYVYVNPVVALLLGALFVNEPITWIKVIALTIILSGVLLVNLPRYKIAKELK
ncbi:MAG: EamA family transporter [Chitinophagaceae bacterium]|nr:EamA family transporter [Chitinophagaceae bacterium]